MLGLASSADRVYVVGNFRSLGGTARTGIARLLPDSTLDLAFRADIDDAPGSAASVVTTVRNKVYVAGAFRSIRDIPRRGFAILNSDGTLVE